MGAGPVRTYAQRATAANSAVVASEPDISTIDAQRGALDRFLDAHPEIQSEVIGRPTVMSDPRYQHEHPELQAFLESHPQVKADPRAFISPREWRYQYHRTEFESILSDIVPLSVFICVLLAVVWVVRAALENRRWNRSFKMHEELHGKLIEKFASGQDFSTYLQTEAGRRLLEWTPPALDTVGGRPHAIGRILWSLQAGVVLLLVGVGLLVLRGHMDPDVTSPLLVFGTLGLTLGAGFILSALISYGLTKHLGLIGAPGQENELAVRR
jgi:hypothetical protein